MTDRYRLLQEPKDEALNWSCGFAETRAQPACLDEAVWHGFVLDESAQHIVAMMSSCDEHKAAMALSADFIHPMDTPCGVPGSQFSWPENYCHLPEAEQDIAAVIAAEVPA